MQQWILETNNYINCYNQQYVLFHASVQKLCLSFMKVFMIDYPTLAMKNINQILFVVLFILFFKYDEILLKWLQQQIFTIKGRMGEIVQYFYHSCECS